MTAAAEVAPVARMDKSCKPIALWSCWDVDRIPAAGRASGRLTHALTEKPVIILTIFRRPRCVKPVEGCHEHQAFNGRHAA